MPKWAWECEFSFGPVGSQRFVTGVRIHSGLFGSMGSLAQGREAPERILTPIRFPGLSSPPEV